MSEKAKGKPKAVESLDTSKARKRQRCDQVASHFATDGRTGRTTGFEPSEHEHVVHTNSGTEGSVHPLNLHLVARIEKLEQDNSVLAEKLEECMLQLKDHAALIKMLLTGQTVQPQELAATQKEVAEQNKMRQEQPEQRRQTQHNAVVQILQAGMNEARNRSLAPAQPAQNHITPPVVQQVHQNNADHTLQAITSGLLRALAPAVQPGLTTQAHATIGSVITLDDEDSSDSSDLSDTSEETDFSDYVDSSDED